MVRQTLDRHALPAQSLILEITENWLTSDFDTASRVIGKLGDLGLRISIDDFGAGATSLAILRDLAVSELKLDRAFTVALSGNGGRELDLVRSTIQLGHSLGMKIVAEGVEDDATLELLTRLGCDLAQGYHISKPKPPNELSFRSKARTARAAA